MLVMMGLLMLQFNSFNAWIRKATDDTSLYVIVDNPDHAAQLLNADLEKITKWAETWLVKFNPGKTESLLISRKTSGPIHPQSLC